ncbi:chloride channel protein [Pyruvatibacter mobilis]|uniref:chloride channel protein n=1 Tax=Pyruvatibacter mobilis TaxID=1712261 RepID=UPI003C7CBBA8
MSLSFADSRTSLESALRRATTSPVPRVWLAAVLVGIAAGYAALGFRLAIGGVQFLWIGDAEENLFRLLQETPAWIIIAGPTLAGLVVGLWLTYIHPTQRPEAIADVIEARAIGAGRLPIWRGLSAAVISAISLGGGASTGREGPAVHLGAALGSFLAQRFGFTPTHMRTLLAAGAASAVAASFNAPIAGALFALEVVLGHYALRASGPIVIASVIGALIVRFHMGASPAFVLPDYMITSLADFPAFAALGVISALVAIGFMQVAMKTDDLARRITMPLWLRPVAGGLGLGLIGLWFPEVLGVGYAATDAALQGEFGLTLLVSLVIAKIIAASLTIASRFGGGVFSPSLYLGAMAGGAFGLILSYTVPDIAFSSHAVYALVGMGAVAGAVLGAPLSTLLIAFELTGGYEMTIALMVSISIATALTQGLLGKSFFQWQLERRGLNLYGGPRWQILQTVLVQDFMRRVTEDPNTPLQTLDEDDERLFTGDSLEKTLALFESSQHETLPVVQPSEQLEIVGTVHHTDALRAYNEALVEASREEHS